MKPCYIANLIVEDSYRMRNMWNLFGDFRPLEHLLKPVYKQALEWATEKKQFKKNKHGILIFEIADCCCYYSLKRSMTGSLAGL